MRIRWEIDIDEARTPREAAEMAWSVMTEPGNQAVVFNVFDENGTEHIIDLLEEE